MTGRLTRAFGIAVGTAAFVIMTGQGAIAWQSPTTSPGQATAPGSALTSRTSPDQQVTLSGCIQSEAEYRRALDAGRGGVANTGVGTGNEFVLINAMLAPAGGASAAPATGTSPNAPSATGTSGTTGGAYELSGTKEGDAAAYVGKRVEITGMLKPAASAAGGPTADLPGSRDLKLREVEVSSIREASVTCSTPSVR
jgi:hypothetical protein